eukprot:753022-Hanusia_phi.AAC.1
MTDPAGTHRRAWPGGNRDRDRTQPLTGATARGRAVSQDSSVRAARPPDDRSHESRQVGPYSVTQCLSHGVQRLPVPVSTRPGPGERNFEALIPHLADNKEVDGHRCFTLLSNLVATMKREVFE